MSNPQTFNTMGTFNNNSTWGKILNILITILTAIATTFGAQSCMWLRLAMSDERRAISDERTSKQGNGQSRIGSAILTLELNSHTGRVQIKPQNQVLKTTRMHTMKHDFLKLMTFSHDDHS